MCSMNEPEDDVEDLNMSNVDSIIENCTNLVEAKYLLQHLFNNCLEQAVAAAKAESLNKSSIHTPEIMNKVTIDCTQQ
uniref:Meis_PKNOX_N domain-containing protein n=1 Tax=Heterorhabditis bacteriophora TaxID=37862 RepID=A0A1I7WY74_HETBA